MKVGCIHASFKTDYDAIDWNDDLQHNDVPLPPRCDADPKVHDYHTSSATKKINQMSGPKVIA